MAYQVEVMSFIVKPSDEPIYSEMATIVTRIDEGASEFVCIDQSGCGNGLGKIYIDKTEWKQIKWAVEDLLSRIDNVHQENDEQTDSESA